MLPPRYISWAALPEQSRDRAAARAYYDEISREYPNQYYAMLARDTCSRSPVRCRVEPSPAAAEFLRTIGFPQRARTTVFDASACFPSPHRARQDAGFRGIEGLG